MSSLITAITVLTQIGGYGLPAEGILACRLSSEFGHHGTIVLTNQSRQPISILIYKGAFTAYAGRRRVDTGNGRDTCGPGLTIENWRIIGPGEALSIPNAVRFRPDFSFGPDIEIEYRYPITLLDMLPSLSEERGYLPEKLELSTWSPLGNRFIRYGKWTSGT